MRGKRALLLLIFILFLALPVTDMDWTKYMENSGSATEDLLTNLTEEEIKRSIEGKYRDGIVGNFDYFINRGYPSGCTRAVGDTGSG